MRRKAFVAACILALVQTLMGAPQSKRPAVYIDRGICPGEGCSYKGRAKVLNRTTVYAAPGIRSGRVFQLIPGEVVTSLDSQVHTVAGHFVVKRAHERYRPGDVLWVYTYLGEGMFKVWHRGRMYVEDLEFSPWGGTTGKRCEQEERYCWGKLDKELEMIWWLKVRSKGGRKGWIRVGNNLEWEDQAE
jgi:hypothetical protein